MARRPGTLDPVLAELRAELLHRMRSAPAMPSRDPDRRRVPRLTADVTARLIVGDMSVEGRVGDVGVGGLYVATHLLVEIGERVIVESCGHRVVARVAWRRRTTDDVASGLGLAFELRDGRAEREALEMVLAILDA